MSNFRDDILKAADGPILGIVIGSDEWSSTGGAPGVHDMGPHPDREMFDRVLSWEEASPWLDREYDSGFGGADCYSIWAWTETRVLFVHEYDGATGVNWVPRFPVDGQPTYGGSYT